jgi:hypothetical protein
MGGTRSSLSTLAVTLALVVGGCGGTDSGNSTTEATSATTRVSSTTSAGDAAATNPGAPCEVVGYGTFTTAMASCDAALEEGRGLVVAFGQGTIGYDDGINIALFVHCSILQDPDAEMTTEVQESKDLAVALSQRVCPGDPDNLTFVG